MLHFLSVIDYTYRSSKVHAYLFCLAMPYSIGRTETWCIQVSNRYSTASVDLPNLDEVCTAIRDREGLFVK